MALCCAALLLRRLLEAIILKQVAAVSLETHTNVARFNYISSLVSERGALPAATFALQMCRFHLS